MVEKIRFRFRFRFRLIPPRDSRWPRFLDIITWSWEVDACDHDIMIIIASLLQNALQLSGLLRYDLERLMTVTATSWSLSRVYCKTHLTLPDLERSTPVTATSWSLSRVYCKTSLPDLERSMPVTATSWSLSRVYCKTFTWSWEVDACDHDITRIIASLSQNAL
jgi:hypothetical protein